MDQSEDYFFNSLFKFISPVIPSIIKRRLFKGRINIETDLAGGRLALGWFFVSLILTMSIGRFFNGWLALLFLLCVFFVLSLYNYSLQVRRMHDLGMSRKEFYSSGLVKKWYKSLKGWSRLNNWEVRELSDKDNKYGKKPSLGVDWKALFGMKR